MLSERGVDLATLQSYQKAVFSPRILSKEHSQSRQVPCWKTMELPSLLKGVATMFWDSSEIAVQNADYSGRHDPFRVQPWTCVMLCIAHVCCALQRTPVPRSLRTPGCFGHISRTCADNAQHTTRHQHHAHTARQSASVTTNSAPR